MPLDSNCSHLHRPPLQLIQSKFCERPRHAFFHVAATASRLVYSSGLTKEVTRMKRMIPVALSILMMTAIALAQTPEEMIEKALVPAPRQLKDGATVIKWKSDFTYDTLRKGTNRLVCYDRSGQPGQQPFAVECTSIANLDRVAQSLKIEAMGDAKTVRAAFEALEKEGKWTKPEFGSLWIHFS